VNENKNGYWIYSVVAIIFGIGLFGFFGWLIYSLIIKLATAPITNGVVIQSLITLIITVFIGGYFSKKLEHRNAKKIELYKIQTSISIKVIDLATIYFRHPKNEEIKDLLIAESCKVKLYFEDEVLLAINEFIKAVETEKENKYYIIVDKLQKNIR